MAKQWLSALAAAASSVAWLAGCAPDLGECDETMLGGSADVQMPAPHSGQIIVNRSCAGGRCHSSAAEGDARAGAPAELDFDVVPANTSAEEIAKVRDGAALVQDMREDMWALIEDGDMPPPPPEGGELSAADKETVRNWLACGAPVIATPRPDMGGADWPSIFTDMMDHCVTCHGTAAAASAAGGGFTLGATPCEAYANIVGKPAVGTECGATGMTLVAPGNPAGSLLLHKLKGTQTCGGHMPLTDPQPLATSNPMLVMRLEQWIMGGAMAQCP